MNNVIQQMLSGASIDTESGFVARLNGAAIESNMEAMAVQLRQSLDGLTASQKGAMLIGTKAIRNANPEVLPPITPYRVLCRGIGFSALPDNLRHSLVITLEDQTGVTMLSWKAFLPELGGKRLALKFTAATEADETAVVALAEEQIGVFTVPSSVHVKPVLTLNGETLIAGSPVGFGAKNQLSYGFRAPTISTPDIANIINAGELFAIGLDLSSISSKQLSDESTYFQNIMSLVASGQYDDAVGDGNLAERMLQAIIWGWFLSQSDVSSFALSRSVDAETIRYPSAGLCFLELKSNTLFGVALSASMSGLSLDIDRDVVVTTSKDGDDTKVKFLSRAQGTIGSSLEGEMPTHFFAGSNQKPLWGSTISLLDRANELGVALISINSNNLDSILPQLSLPQTVKDEIGDAVNAGMKVLAPQSEVTQLRFTGLGYIVEDPVSGSAAYLVSGERTLSGGVFLGSASGICDAKATAIGSAQGVAQSPCEDGTLLNLLKDLLIDAATRIIGGPLLAMLKDLSELFQGFWDVLQCVKAQGIVAWEEFAFNVLPLLVLLVIGGLVIIFGGAEMIAAALTLKLAGEIFLGFAFFEVSPFKNEASNRMRMINNFQRIFRGIAAAWIGIWLCQGLGYGMQPEITNAVAYLRLTQSADGSWGGTESSLNEILPRPHGRSKHSSLPSLADRASRRKLFSFLPPSPLKRFLSWHSELWR